MPRIRFILLFPWTFYGLDLATVWIREQAWKVIHVAKAIDLAEGASEISPPHLLQSCCIVLGKGLTGAL